MVDHHCSNFLTSRAFQAKKCIVFKKQRRFIKAGEMPFFAPPPIKILEWKCQTINYRYKVPTAAYPKVAENVRVDVPAPSERCRCKRLTAHAKTAVSKKNYLPWTWCEGLFSQVEPTKKYVMIGNLVEKTSKFLINTLKFTLALQFSDN